MPHKMMVNPIESAASGAYSPAIRAGEFVYVSAQGPIDPQTRDVAGSSIEEQTDRVMKNLADVLDTAGCTLNDCVKVSVYLADLGDYQAFDKAYRGYFRDPLPARTLVNATPPKGKLTVDVIAMQGAAS